MRCSNRHFHGKRLKFFDFCATCAIGEIWGVKDLEQAAPSCPKACTAAHPRIVSSHVFPRLNVLRNWESEMLLGIMVPAEAAARRAFAQPNGGNATMANAEMLKEVDLDAGRTVLPVAFIRLLTSQTRKSVRSEVGGLSVQLSVREPSRLI
jgi:hypothetical protein